LPRKVEGSSRYAKQIRGIVKMVLWLIVADSFALFLTALLHGSGYARSSRAVEKGGIKSYLTGGFRPLWQMFSIHLLVPSAILIAASQIPKGRRFVPLCTLILSSDTMLLFHLGGVFIGMIALAVATMFFLVGGFMLLRCSAAS
jgi:hypothetical protein